VIHLQLQKETLVIDLLLQKDHLATFEVTLCYRGAQHYLVKTVGLDSKQTQTHFSLQRS
jgi:hypothetical protein